MRIFGHRGSGVGNPDFAENSLESILHAVTNPAVSGIEIDARRSSDGVIVISHEPVHAGLTLIKTPYAELAAAGLCRLSDVLEAVRCSARVIIEVKNVPWEPDFDPIGQETVAGVDEIVSDADDYVISSFDFSTVEAARDRGLAAALLTMPGVRPMAGIGWASDAGLVEVHPWIGDVLGEPACVQQAHDAGLRIVTWTAGSMEQLEQLREIGVDIAISDVLPSAS